MVYMYPGKFVLPRTFLIVQPWTSVFFFFFIYFYYFEANYFTTLQWVLSYICHTLTWISHGIACIPHPDPPSHLPLHLIPDHYTPVRMDFSFVSPKSQNLLEALFSFLMFQMLLKILNTNLSWGFILVSYFGLSKFIPALAFFWYLQIIIVIFFWDFPVIWCLVLYNQLQLSKVEARISFDSLVSGISSLCISRRLFREETKISIMVLVIFTAQQWGTYRYKRDY